MHHRRSEGSTSSTPLPPGTPVPRRRSSTPDLLIPVRWATPELLFPVRWVPSRLLSAGPWARWGPKASVRPAALAGPRRPRRTVRLRKPRRVHGKPHPARPPPLTSRCELNQVPLRPRSPRVLGSAAVSGPSSAPFPEGTRVRACALGSCLDPRFLHQLAPASPNANRSHCAREQPNSCSCATSTRAAEALHLLLLLLLLLLLRGPAAASRHSRPAFTPRPLPPRRRRAPT